MRRLVLRVLAMMVIAAGVQGSSGQARATDVKESMPAGGEVLTAAADGGVSLTGYQDMVVDETHGHVFVAQGTTSLKVVNLSATVAQTLTLPGRANRLAMSEDGSALYVLMTGGDAQLARVDPVTLEVTVVVVDVSPCPKSIAAVQELVWVGSHCAANESLRAVDPATGGVVEVATIAADELLPSDSNHLAVAEIVQSSYDADKVRELAVTGGPEPSAEVTAEAGFSGNIGSLALSPDVSVLYGASHGERAHRWRMPGLGWYQPDGTDLAYHEIGGAIAVRSDGMTALMGDEGGVWFADADGNRVYGSPGLGYDSYVHEDGLAWGSELLYVAVDDQSNDPDRLVTVVPRYDSDLVLADIDSNAVDYGEQVLVRGWLETQSSNRTVHLMAIDETGTHLVTSVEAGEDGYFEAEIVARRTMKMRAVYEGDAETSPSRDAWWDPLYVRALVESEMRGEREKVRGVHTYGVRDRAVIAVRIRPIEPNECVSFILKVRIEGRWRRVDTDCVRRDDRGRAKAYIHGRPEYEGLLWRIKATSDNDTDSSLYSVGPTHEFRFER